MDISEDGKITEVVGTYAGPGQLSTLDPYTGPISAETIAWQAGTRQGFVGSSTFEGQKPTPKVTSIHDKDWTSLAGADFGKAGAASLTARVLPKAGGTVTVSTSPDPDDTDAVVATLTVPAGDGNTWSNVTAELAAGKLTGEQDVYFRYSGEGTDELFDVETWTFEASDGRTATSVSAEASTIVYGRPGEIKVRVTGADKGTVSAVVGGYRVTARVDRSGRAVLRLPPRSLAPGTHTVEVTYEGTDAYAPSSTQAQVQVSKATATLKVDAPPSVRAGEVLTVRVRVKADGVQPTGWLEVALAGVPGATVTEQVRSGPETVVKLQVPKNAKVGRSEVTVRYTGDDWVQPATAARPIDIRK